MAVFVALAVIFVVVMLLAGGYSQREAVAMGAVLLALVALGWLITEYAA